MSNDLMHEMVWQWMFARSIFVINAIPLDRNTPKHSNMSEGAADKIVKNLFRASSIKEYNM